MLPKANSTVEKEVSGIEHLPGTAPHHVGTAALGCPAAQVYRATRAFWEGMGLERPRLHSLRKNGSVRARLSTVPLRPIKDKGLSPLRAARGTFPPHPSYQSSKGGPIMYCNACGKAIAEDGQFCSYCGNVVGIAPTPKKLTRSRADRKFAGVCAGLAQHFDLDPTLVCILCVFLTLATGVCPGIV